MRLKLFHQALFVVSILLAFELILLGSLAYILTAAEQEIKEEARTKQIVYQSSMVTSAYYKTAQALFNFFATHDDSFDTEYRDSLADIDHEYQALVDDCQPYPADTESLTLISASLQKLKRTLEQAHGAVATGESLYSVQRVLTLLRSETVPEHREFLSNIFALQIRHRQLQQAQPQASARLRSYIEWLIGAGVLFNILIAFVLVNRFSARITSRLSTISDNAERMSKAKQLNPLIAGTDEIASLDATFHKMAAALDAAASKERAVVDNMPVGLATIDESTTIISVNPTIGNLSGFGTADLLEKKIAWLLPDCQQFLSGTTDGIVLNTVQEAQVRQTSGAMLPAQISISEYMAAEGKRYIVSIMDITARRQVEQLKKEFVSIVTHDLKTPLTSMMAACDLLLQGSLGGLNDRGTKVVNAARSELKRLMNLIRDLLDLSRMESGIIEVELERVSVSKVIERSVGAVDMLAKKKEIEIACPSIDAWLLADEDRLVQVLVNFLSNAIKFSPPSSKIEIDARQSEQTVHISVADKGPGVPHEFTDSIFERFGQVRRSDQSEMGGTGLGLAIAKMIVDTHHGRIGVDSEAGQGSIFWIEIPKAAGD